MSCNFDLFFIILKTFLKTYKSTLNFFNCSDFDIVYRLSQQSSSRPEIFLSLTSDWDLDAAFHTASYPFLQLQVQPFRREGIIFDYNSRTSLILSLRGTENLTGF